MGVEDGEYGEEDGGVLGGGRVGVGGEVEGEDGGGGEGVDGVGD